MRQKIFETIDLSSFQMKATLNPEVFDVENNKMKIDVRKRFLKAARLFYDEIPTSKEPIDVLLTGSMANYNWSDFSDVDIHVVLDFDEFKGDNELISDYFFKVGENFKHQHNIMFLQYNMEFFIQDSNEIYVKDEGVYSILYDRWLQEPKHLQPNFNEQRIEKYVNHFLLNIKDNLTDYRNGTLSKKDFLDKTSELTDSLRKFRKSGLDSKGEFSEKNIAYKYLRRLGILDKVKDFKSKIFDKNLSVNKSDTPPSEPKKKEKSDGYTDDISYIIHGVTYSSLRDAQKRTGEKKSTIAYRVHSDNPKYNDYRMLTN